jgi:hypothetical protein
MNGRFIQAAGVVTDGRFIRAAALTAAIKGTDSGEIVSLAHSAATASPPLCRPSWRTSIPTV